MTQVDLIIRDVTLFDGNTVDGRTVDIAIAGDLIHAVDDLDSVSAAQTIDAAGLVALPGFIDIHTHSDVCLLTDGRGESKVLQGVTTEVTGNCSFSPFPVTSRHRKLLADHLARLGDEVPDLDWIDLDGYATHLQQSQPTLNVAPLVGHAALRMAAADAPFTVDLSDDEHQRMAALLRSTLEQGAWGMSTGLTHTPSSMGSPREVRDLVAIVSEFDALYATHARATAGQEFTAIDEALEVTAATGVRLEYSHLALNDPTNWGRAAEALARFERARDHGLDVTFDVYPYAASSSSLMQYIPDWVQALGSEGMLSALANADIRANALADLRKGWFGGIAWLWDRFVLSAVEGHPNWEGRSLAEVSDLEAVDPAELVLDLCATIGSSVMVVLHYRDEDDVASFISHPLSLIGSDGNALPIVGGPGLPHPRSFGTFPRVLGRYHRERGCISLADTVHKTSTLAAERLGLDRRGKILPGWFADIVLADIAEVNDVATFAHPRAAGTGIVHTIINGHVVASHGALTGRRPGRVLRRGRP